MKNTKASAAALSKRRDIQQCENCLFCYCDDETNVSKCMRFSRFVDHVINDMTKDCAYWTSRDEE